MKEYHFLVNKTARYYTLGELNEHTRHIWLVLHGFGQKASRFLKNFEPLLNAHTFFIAPEALNHFYLNGASGEVGATWMTKEDRENEMKDYINYLNDVYEQIEAEQFPDAEITVLGFSQGASTASRWVNATSHRINRLIVYAGEVGAEVLPLNQNSPLRRSRNYLVYGHHDKFFTPSAIEKMKAAYAEMNFTEIDFDGGHSIQTEVLEKLF